MWKRGENKVILMGRAGKDAEVRYTPNGTAIASLTLATEISYSDNEGKAQKETEWHDIVIFGKKAEAAGKYFKKGMMLYFFGRIRNNKWQGTDGKMRSNKEIVIDDNGEMQMLPGAGPRNTSAEGQGGTENHDEPPFPDMNDYPQ
ncbi:single-stranded DNA-binding protein [Salmonella enterica subsp. enterica serovar Give]|nr:single-stranded DNA-binding protein [Salmonella enterica subsp. enterica serovar Give]ECA4141900.1 single-stranded DNA-binding protein [Salmonella enterica subsp. enterica serovar Give]